MQKQSSTKSSHTINNNTTINNNQNSNNHNNHNSNNNNNNNNNNNGPHNQNKMYFRSLSSHHLYSQHIHPLLIKLSSSILPIQQLILKLRQFKIFSQQSRKLIQKQKLNQFTFTQLISFTKSQASHDLQIPKLFSQMANFILQKQHLFKIKHIQILLQKYNQPIKFNKQQVIYILCLMALNLVPIQQYDQIPNKRDKFPKWNDFSYIFSQQLYKTQTILRYFHHHFNNNQWKHRNQIFIIKRNYIHKSIQQLIKQNQQKSMTQYHVQNNKTSIQQSTGQIKVDFANKFIGGGALHSGCVQQQIMFSNHPQLFITGIFCQVMLPQQSILLQGFRKYSENSGYGWTVKYHHQQLINQQTFKTQQNIIAIDAIRFQPNKSFIQYQKDNINRQLMKAYAGFSNLQQKLNVVTGNWGCGAFHGQVRVKFLIQWLACSMADKDMIYCPFGSQQLIMKNKITLQKLSKKTVGQVYDLLIKAGRYMQKNKWNIFRLIDELINQQKQKMNPKI